MSITRKGAMAGITSRGPKFSDAGFLMTALPIEVIDVPQFDGYVTIGDAVYERHAPATVHNEYSLVLQENVLGALKLKPSFQSTDGSIASVDEDGKIAVQDFGECGIIARTRLWSQRVDLDTKQRASVTTDQFSHWVEGSLAEDVSNAVDTRIAGKTPSVTKPIYSTQDHAAETYVRNASCWASDLDLTGISPWNSRGGNKRAGTLITSDAMICAKHYGFTAGDRVRFVRADNSVVTMTVKVGGVRNIDDTDIQICVFTEEVPAGIAHYKVFPSDVMNHFLRISSDDTGVSVPWATHTLPALVLDQEEKALVVDIFKMDTGVNGKYPINETRLAFNESLIPGDSGNPVFLIVADELVLTTCLLGGFGGYGPAYHHYLSEINAQLAAGGSAHTLTVIGGL